jgi:23S rRNA (cytosine1962-C5)-methyltransferase
LEEAEVLPSEHGVLLLLEPRGKVAASALFDAKSSVPIRVYQRGRREFNEEFALARWREAIQWRQRVVLEGGTDAYRLLHSEGDQTPGLIVDRFGGHLSVSASMRSWQNHLAALANAAPPEWNLQSCFAEIHGDMGEVLGSAPELIPYRVNGFRLFARPSGGQKTGAFLDQRENYLALVKWMNTLTSKEYGLDLYSSNGGFARHMASVVSRVEAVERGQAAIELLEKGLSADSVSNVKAIRSDVQEFMLGKAQARRSYDVLVVDPPAFAKSRRERESALRQYAAINAKALRLVRGGGLFVTCSCSHHVSSMDLLDVIREVSMQNEKTLQILEMRAQSSDHPVLLQVPETEYLKCFYFRVI